MDIIIHSSVSINKGFEEYTIEKFGKLDKFLHPQASADIHIKKEGSMMVCEIKISSKNINIFLKEEDHDINKGIELLFNRTKRQLSKEHDKKIDKMHNQL